MDLDIRNCLELRAVASMGTFKDELLEYCLEDPVSEAAIIVPVSTLRQSKLGKLLDTYEITGLCDLGVPFLETNVRMVLLTLVRKNQAKRKLVRIANWHGDAYDSRLERPSTRSKGGLSCPTRFFNEYETYLSAIETWFNKEVAPADGNPCEYVEISRGNLDLEHLAPKYYSKRARNLRKSLAKTPVSALAEIAEISCPRPLKDSQDLGPVLDTSSIAYPINPACFKMRQRTNTVLSKGDLIYPLVQNYKPCIFREEQEERIFAPAHSAVIRCKGVAPEYLYLYLTSETGKLLREILGAGFNSQQITIEDLKKFPVVLPEKSPEHYVQLFESTHYHIADFSRCYSLQATTSTSAATEPQHAEDILNAELIENMVVFKDEIRKDILASDLQELNTCYAHGAHKATLILAGSILEAILIDWLSEIKGKNFFDENEEYIDGRGRCVDTLAGYIGEIKYLYRPKWMESQKAFTIKEKRNLVHAKLCLKDEAINAETCEMVISYLKDVIESRNRFARRRK